MRTEQRHDILNIARVLEKQAERCRMQVAEIRATTSQGDIRGTATAETIKYVGALASILASTLCELVESEQQEEIFSIAKTNTVLREWGLDELV